MHVDPDGRSFLAVTSREVNSSAGTSHTLRSPSATTKALRVTGVSFVVSGACEAVLNVGETALGRWDLPAAGSGIVLDWTDAPEVLPVNTPLTLTTSQSVTVKGHVRAYEVP